MDSTTCVPLPTRSCPTRGDIVNLTLLSVAGALSASAVLIVCRLIKRNATREAQRPDRLPLFRQPMDVYVLSLLAADLIHSIGSLLNIKWVAEGKSETGPSCTAQGLFNQAGVVSVGLNTLLIAVVTFITVWRDTGAPTTNRAHSLRVACAVVAALWLSVAILVAIPATIHSKPSDLYWVPEPLWCTISAHYLAIRMLAKYLYLWAAFIGSAILYILLGLLVRGYIVRNPGTWCGFSIQKRGGSSDGRGPAQMALFWGLIAYPLSNAILIVPLSVVRWLELASTVHITATQSTAVGIAFAFSGFVNVLLLLYIRPNLLLLGRKKDLQDGHCECCTAKGPMHPVLPATPMSSGYADSARMMDT